MFMGTLPVCCSAEPPFQTPIDRRGGVPGAPYINSWLVLGPFDSGPDGSDHSFITEATARPQDGSIEAGQTWRYFDDRLFSRNLDDYNDLFSYFHTRQGLSISGKTAYACVYVFSQTTCDVQFRVGADTQFRAWVNGEQIGASAVAGPVNLIMEPRQASQNSGRDYVLSRAHLRSGWNTFLLKVSNREEGRFGFYARFTTEAGLEPPGLFYSTGGGEGSLRIATRAMPWANTGDLPAAYREWPYFDTHPDRQALLRMGTALSGPDGQKPPHIPGIGVGFSFNAALGMQASAFLLNAAGGSAPYVWKLESGALPAGMSLLHNGTLHGTPVVAAKLGSYAICVSVTDSAGHRALRKCTLQLQERPNRWLELARMTALIHGPENLSAEQIDEMARLMKRQGYGLAFPISYNNGDMLFRYPSRFGQKHTGADVIAEYRSALIRAGIGFGMYMGNLNVPGSPDFSVNQMVLVVEEAMRRYHPQAFWFDWLGLDGTSLDSLFSAIRSIDPTTLIIVNGSERMSNGDWDNLTFEGWGAWGANAWRMWPVDFPWPKRAAPETWRLAVEPAFSGGGGALSDWTEMLRVQLSLIGEGCIANMDHTPRLAGSTSEQLERMELMKLHFKMAAWANPAGIPALSEAYTNVDPQPIASAQWGYSTINAARDTIYLIVLSNPRGKTGLPADQKIVIENAPAITGAVLMNGHNLLRYQYDVPNRKLSVDLHGVPKDPVALVVKLNLKKPLRDYVVPRTPIVATDNAPVNARKEIPPGNLAFRRPAWLMSADGGRELGPSAGAYAVYGVDGSLNTAAQAAYEWAWSYKIDLQVVHALNRVVVCFDEKSWATHFKLLFSIDGRTWTPGDDLLGKPGPNTIALNHVEARFLRVQAIKPDGPGQTGSQMGITELQAFSN